MLSNGYFVEIPTTEIDKDRNIIPTKNALSESGEFRFTI